MNKTLKTTLVMGVIVDYLTTSCKKSDTTTTGPTPTPTPVQTVFMIYKDSMYAAGTTSNTTVKTYIYNSSKKLVKINYFKYSPTVNFYKSDTLIYNSSGQVVTVKTFSTGATTPTKTQNMSYNGSGQLTLVSETGNNGSSYTLTGTYVYSSSASGKPSSYTSVYSPTTAGTGDNVSSIVYTSGNMTSCIFDTFTITATNDLTAANPYYGLYNDGTDFINLFNQNNVLKAQDNSATPNILANNSYSYNNGRVSRITDQNNTPNYITDITYKEY